ncbi:MAG TPA: sulfite exporter TauE/SafE family protein [Candidatus Dormibacteraeota bacterium]|nr:sulfite exporter TauE/SafE family protein [Candidatus Dormibacteraeota bacterium]
MTPQIASSPSGGAQPLHPQRLLAAGALGVVAGVLSGLLGVGGGLILVPGMVLLLGIRQHVANATSLAAIIPTAVAGVAAFGKASAVDWRIGALLIAGSIPGAQLGATAMRRIPAAQLRVVFGVFVIAVGIVLLVTR